MTPNSNNFLEVIGKPHCYYCHTEHEDIEKHLKEFAVLTPCLPSCGRWYTEQPLPDWRDRFEKEIGGGLNSNPAYKEQVKSFISRLCEEKDARFSQLLEELKVEEKDIGEKTYCKTCKGHQAAGECECGGWNTCARAINAKIDERQRLLK